MWLKVLALVGCLLVSGCTALLCEHYSTVAHLEDDNPCGSTDETGVCNTTIECKADRRHQHVHCFSLWKNESGVITVLKKGCWSEQSSCVGRSSCSTNIWDDNMYCCCEEDLCNAQMNYESNDFSTTASYVDPEVHSEEADVTLVALIGTLAPISAICIIAAIAFWCYRKRKQAFDDVDMNNAETPGSAVTTTTLATSLLSPGQPELKFPQLLVLKARGRFGCVWKAQLHDSFVAVKIFNLQDKQSWQNEQDIFNTSLVADHPNILRYITATMRGVGVQAELWLITEFHDSGSLADYLKVHTPSISESLRILETMATGLAFLHENVACRTAQNGYKPAIAHRDFKSKNVLITDQKTAVIADFGLAMKFVPGESTGDSHGQVGTRRYMAPEVLEGAINFQRDAFLRIDMYAFALVAWEVLTRCFDVPGGPVAVYLLPYELEVGQHPNLEEMQECVVDKKVRPKIPREWRQHEIFGVLSETIEECWDHDAEARLSAGCAQERIHNLVQKVITPPTELPIRSNCLSPEIVTNVAPINPTPSNIDIQNQINNQKNEVRFSAVSTNEEANLLGKEHHSPPENPMSTHSTSMLLPLNEMNA